MQRQEGNAASQESTATGLAISLLFRNFLYRTRAAVVDVVRLGPGLDDAQQRFGMPVQRRHLQGIGVQKTIKYPL